MRPRPASPLPTAHAYPRGVPEPGRSSIRAALDVGSNSIHLLVASVDGPRLDPIADESVQLGLGDVVEREGRITSAARDALLDALEMYVHRAEALGSEPPIQLATEPLRRASNRSVIQADVLRATGRTLQILSHEAEAGLTLLGVTDGSAPQTSMLVVDVGGGSTEAIFAAPDRDPVVGALPTGSASLTQVFVAHDPPTWFELNNLRAEAIRLVGMLPEPDHELGLHRQVAVGGTATNLERFADAAGSGIDRASLSNVFDAIAGRPAAELAGEKLVSARRARQMAGGAALLDAILARYDLASFEVSRASLREGAIHASASAMTRGGDDWLERLPDRLR
jgi:exopolyphosphatase / guanosine-5'-triphosphate,3'-diphosphate pyrophosphatase